MDRLRAGGRRMAAGGSAVDLVAMRRAARVDGNHAEIARALEATGCYVQSLAAVGNGVPDLLVGRAGAMVLMEVKDGRRSPSDRRLTPDQVKWHAEWRGPPVVVVLSVDDALRAIDFAINRGSEVSSACDL